MISVLEAFGRKSIEIKQGRKPVYLYIPEQHWDCIDNFIQAFKELPERKRKRLLEHKKYSFDKLTYYFQVWMYTERNTPNIKGIEKRNFENVIDHIVPIIYGYRNKINPIDIGCLTNLRIISREENLRKNSKILYFIANIIIST